MLKTKNIQDKKAVLFLASFFIGLFLLSILLGLSLGSGPQAYWRANDPNFWRLWSIMKGRYQESGNEGGLKVLMLGSSRTQFGFQGAIVEQCGADLSMRGVSAVGFGFAGAGPLYQWILARRLVELGEWPDLVALEIHPALILDHQGKPMELNWLDRNRLDPTEQNLLEERGIRFGSGSPKGSALDPWCSWYPLRHSLTLPLRQALIRFENGGPGELLKYDSWGGPAFVSGNDPTSKQRETGIAQARKDYQPFLSELPPGGPALDCLEQTLAHFQQYGLPVVMIRYPEGPAFRSWYRPGLNDEVMGILGEMAQRYNARLVDAWTWLGEEEFSDSHHMTRKGATEFSRRLAQEQLLKPGICTGLVRDMARPTPLVPATSQAP